MFELSIVFLTSNQDFDKGTEFILTYRGSIVVNYCNSIYNDIYYTIKTIVS